MGLFKAFKDVKNVVSSSNGVGADAYLGRALVVDASLSGMGIGIGTEQYRVCNIRMQVFLDNNPAYMAELQAEGRRVAARSARRRLVRRSGRSQ